LLDVTRLQAGRITLHLEQTDVVALARRVMARLQMTTGRDHLSLYSPPCLPPQAFPWKCLYRLLHQQSDHSIQATGLLVDSSLAIRPCSSWIFEQAA
jgi:hypothetical protein